MSANFCVIGLMGIELLCFGGGDGKPVIDATCDLRRVELPADWKGECLNEYGRIRPGLPEKKARACRTLAGNNRVIRERCG